MDYELEVVNIISRQVARDKITGPKKVLLNACKGFDRLGIKYVFNEPISKHRFNWIHDDPIVLIEAGFIGRPVVVGPNIAVLPKDLPIFRKKLPDGSIYLHPCKWTIDVWKLLGFSEVALKAWPVGIDTDKFENIPRNDKVKVLLYFKQRDLNLLDLAKRILDRMGISYILIEYGRYSETEYIAALAECRYGVWIGCSESQGIALQEAMATNLLLIVLEAATIFDTVPTKSKGYVGYDFPKKLSSVKTSSVPYFDDRCGIKIDSIEDLEKAINELEARYSEFNPRDFVKSELSLDGRANQLMGYLQATGSEFKPAKNDFKKLSKFLFFAGLIFQKWAWKWVAVKILNKLSVPIAKRS